MEANRDIPSTVIVGNCTVSSSEFIYLLAQSISNINNKKLNDLIKVINLSSTVNPSFPNVVLSTTKSQYLSIVNSIIKKVNSYNIIPSTVSISSKTLDYKSYSYGLANILLNYKSKGTLPSSYKFSASILAPDNFFTQYYGKDVTFYLTSDRITDNINNDKKMLNQLASTLKSLGFKTKVIGVGPNMHNIAYKYGCKGKNAVLLACFSGVDVGCIEEWTGEAGSWFKNAYKGAHMIAVFYTSPYAVASDLNKKVGQAWDANYGWPLASPANDLIFHNINYIQAHSPNIVCDILKNTFTKSKSKSVIKAPNIKFDYLSSGNLVIKLTNSKGKALANKNVIVRVNGNSKVYKLVTDSKGVAKLKFSGSIKTYNVVVYFNGDSTYLPSSVKSKITITKVKTVIKAPVVKSYVTGKATYLVVYLKDSHGNPLSKKTVKITVKGLKTYTKVTDKNGVAKLKFSKKVKTYKVSVKYAGSKYYLASSVSSKVSMYKTPTKLNAIYENTSNESGRLKIQCIDQEGNALSKKSIKIKFLDTNKIYTSITDSLGLAYLNLDTIQNISTLISFSGDKLYTASSLEYTFVPEILENFI